MSLQFEYYHSRESEQFAFFRIPKALFTEPMFQDLSTYAKLLYGLMLDRIGLSVRSGWWTKRIIKSFIFISETGVK